MAHSHGCWQEASLPHREASPQGCWKVLTWRTRTRVQGEASFGPVPHGIAASFSQCGDPRGEEQAGLYSVGENPVLRSAHTLGEVLGSTASRKEYERVYTLFKITTSTF